MAPRMRLQTLPQAFFSEGLGSSSFMPPCLTPSLVATRRVGRDRTGFTPAMRLQMPSGGCGDSPDGAIDFWAKG